MSARESERERKQLGRKTGFEDTEVESILVNTH